ncbi:hypothetical protein C8A00DRAFT_18653 [Chaetomidium leptoderma]|uniref:Ysc84 actin-binding domain-containing protein n=1 Tax=Chaetomidium leptoderma TaxID=669021 RepID=A0AAN6VFR6_9PEZI|nr:hypothetical protein C8A00DRAFT_18653 [Chaetomidium leptoderma]
MSSNEKQPPANPAAQQGQQQYFPPPPPGPPPAQTTQARPAAAHTNETPIPDYDIPAYNPARPQFAPPPAAADDDDIYNASPTGENAPRWGHHSHHAQAQGGDGESKKKSNRLSAFGEAFTSKVAGPVNALANKLGSEGFLPESLDKECDKAARILSGFCKHGIYSDVVPPTAPSSLAQGGSPPPPAGNKGKPPKKPRVLLHIPHKVIARAQGLAIFTAVRLGFQATGSSGSGVLVARLPDGRGWSPPSGIQITSIGAGFVAGVDIYDCVIVINTREALEQFAKMRLSLGSDLAVTAGPFGAGAALGVGVSGGGGGGDLSGGEDKEGRRRGRDETLLPAPTGAAAAAPPTTTITPPPPPALSADNTHFQTGPVPEDQQGMGMGEEDEKDRAKHQKHKDRRPSPFREAIKKPVYSYVKSRGLYAGVQIDGTVVAERASANAKFYGRAVPVAKILRGEVPAPLVGGPQASSQDMWPSGASRLTSTLASLERMATEGQGEGPVAPAPHVTGGPAAPAPTFGAAAGTGGAPSSAWVPPPAQGVPGITAGVRNLGVGGSTAPAPAPPAAAGPSTIPPSGAPAPVPVPTAGASAKAAEAASDAARAELAAAPPPTYSEAHGTDDLPPAYVEEDRDSYRPAGGDSKTGLH